MSGTYSGGLKAAETNKLMHGPDFYRRIGKIGGTKSRGGGFTNNPELARLAGMKVKGPRDETIQMSRLAKMLRDEGHTRREICQILGYSEKSKSHIGLLCKLDLED